MKKGICLLMVFAMLLGLCACGQGPAEQEAAAWTRQGYFSDENEDMLSITWMEDIDEPGWYVGLMLGEYWGGCTLTQEGNALHGDLSAWDESAEPFVVTITEEGEDGLLLAVEGGESYHFTRMELPEATIFVTINTEGLGNIAHAEGEETPEIDPDYPFQSAQINLAEPATYTIVAWPKAGNVFVKWTKNGQDFSTEPQITVLLDESADFVAVFEEDPDWQNPVMNFVGEYQSGRAHAQVECFGSDEAWITIDWGSSAWELTRWIISGRLDTDTLTIAYSGANKSNLVYGDDGEIKSQEEVYQDGTGTISFRKDGGFTWHEDQSERGEDLVFEWLPAADGFGLANPWREITEAEAGELCARSFTVPEGAENPRWSVLDSAAGASGVPGALVQLSFDLDGNSFTAREQLTGGEEADTSGMYYTWVDEREELLKNWADGNMTAHLCRSIGENGYVDLCTWYDAEAGVSYSLSVTAADLDGFDLLAVAEQLHS